MFSSRLALPLFSLLCAACSSATAQGPAWPEQSSPSYPEPPPYQGPLADLGSPAERVEPKVQTGQAAKAQPAASAKTESEYEKAYGNAQAIQTLNGRASYYADSLAGNHTANGDIYQPNLPTAAHKKLAFGTIVRVTRIDNQKVTYVRINDRGPFGDKTRIIDLSRFAAKQLDMIAAGVVDVKVEIVHKPL